MTIVCISLHFWRLAGIIESGDNRVELFLSVLHAGCLSTLLTAFCVSVYIKNRDKMFTLTGNIFPVFL